MTTPPAPSLTLYGASASGAIAVEAALTLLGIPYTLIEGATWAEPAARERVATQNALRQVPTLVLPGGEPAALGLLGAAVSAGLAPDGRSNDA